MTLHDQATTAADAADEVCSGCGAAHIELGVGLLCMGCEGSLCDLLAGVFEQAPGLLTRAELAAEVGRRWSSLVDPARASSQMLDRWVDSEVAEEVAPGRYRLVPDVPQ